MAEYSRQEAAARAGLDRSYIDRLIALAIIAPSASDQLTNGDAFQLHAAHRAG